MSLDLVSKNEFENMRRSLDKDVQCVVGPQYLDLLIVMLRVQYEVAELDAVPRNRGVFGCRHLGIAYVTCSCPTYARSVKSYFASL